MYRYLLAVHARALQPIACSDIEFVGEINRRRVHRKVDDIAVTVEDEHPMLEKVRFERHEVLLAAGERLQVHDIEEPLGDVGKALRYLKALAVVRRAGEKLFEP